MLDSAPTRPEVTAIVVTCGVTPYLRHTLEGVGAQTWAPTRLVVVDIYAQGRDLGTGEDIRAIATELGLDARMTVRVVRAPESTTFGDAVKRGLVLNAEAQRKADKLHQTRTGDVPIVHSDTTAGWVWLLHDDSAPQPRALEELLRVGESGPSIGIAGAKQLDWARPEHLLEVGIQATRSARRHNPIDEDEIDQGQHDSVADVLAVGLAGAIVRRDVWAKLEGTDPALGPFGDGLELCRRARLAGYRVVMVPAAAVEHARATYLGLRSFGHGPPKATTPDFARSYGARRRAQLYNWLLAVPGWQLPLVLALLLVLTPIRAIGRFAMKDMGRARAELSSGFAVLSRPDLWMAGRRRIRGTQVVSASRLADLEVSAREIRRKKRELRRMAAESREIHEAPSELELAERAALAARRRSTGIILTTLLVGVAAIGLSRLLGIGQLSGGALLGSNARFGEVFELVTSGWIPAGHGSPGPADPLYFAALVPMVTGISLGAAATALLLLAVPVAGVGAWFAAGTLTRSIGLRVWATVLWALAPSLLFAVLQGRLGPTLVHVVLPFLVIALRRATGSARRDVILSGMVGAKRVVHPDSVPSADGDATAEPMVSAPAVTAPADPVATVRPSLGAGAAAALLLAALAVAAPLLLAPALLLWLALLFTPARRTTWFLPLPALALLAPLVTALVRTGEWEALAAGAGPAFGYEPATPLAVLVGIPAATGTGGLPEWFVWLTWAPTAFAILIALIALVRGTFRGRIVRVGWLFAVLGLALALAAPHVAVGVDAGGTAVRAWPGAGTSLALLGVLVAALAGSDGLPQMLARHQFGWRHLVSALLAGAAALSALAATGVWVASARSEIPELQVLGAAPANVTPAVAQQLAQSGAQARTLAIQANPDGTLTTSLWRGDGPQLHHTSALAGARQVDDPLAFTLAGAAGAAGAAEAAGGA
ncbi:MAG: glycosyltransferase family 2 protein, partial [bacterium]|nr:glycosyltransferase family 2 protein [bacterium]